MQHRAKFLYSYRQKSNGGVYMESKTEELIDIETAIAYAQLAVHTLQNSKTDITAKELRSEIKMLYEKFGTKEVKRLTNIIIKKKQ